MSASCGQSGAEGKRNTPDEKGVYRYETTEISQRYVFCPAFHPVSGLCYGLVTRLSPVDLRNFIHPCAVRRSTGLFLLPVRQRDRMDHERAACAADKAHAKRIPRGVAGMHDRVLCAGCSERHEAGAGSGFDLAVSCVFVLWTGRDRLCTGYVRNLGLNQRILTMRPTDTFRCIERLPPLRIRRPAMQPAGIRIGAIPDRFGAVPVEYRIALVQEKAGTVLTAGAADGADA